MQTQNRLFDDLSKLATNTIGTVQGVAQEMEIVMRQQIERLADNLDLISRDEFEAVKELAANAREENVDLTDRISELEAMLRTALAKIGEVIGGDEPATTMALAAKKAPKKKSKAKKKKATKKKAKKKKAKKKKAAPKRKKAVKKKKAAPKRKKAVKKKKKAAPKRKKAAKKKKAAPKRKKAVKKKKKVAKRKPAKRKAAKRKPAKRKAARKKK